MVRRYILCSILLLVCGCSAQADSQCVRINVDMVVDGDTLRLQDGRWVRCAAIDTPEIDHQNKRADPFGYEARDILNKLVKSGSVCMENGKPREDRYGRIVAYLFDQNGHMINNTIVAQGFGHVYPHLDENKQYAAKLLASQRQAMQNRLGIWLHRLEAKGAFIGNKRSKRFHLESCPSGLRISPKNRIAFTAIWDAYWAGYAPAHGCLGSPIKKQPKHLQ